MLSGVLHRHFCQTCVVSSVFVKRINFKQMEYKGKLYGKVHKSYFPLEATTDDFEALQTNIELLKKKLQVAEKALNDIVKWDDDLEYEWGDPGERASRCLEKLALLDGF